MTSLYCYGMPLCRLATGTEPQSTMVGSMRSMACSVTRSTSISYPTLCFLTGAHGPHGLLGPTGTMLRRRLLTWHSLPCARRTWLLLQAHPSHCILSRTALPQSGRLTWIRWAMSFRFTTTTARCTWPDMSITYFSCSTTPRRSVTWPRRMGSCISRSGIWRATFATRRKRF
jgi:hypothetical protein